MKHIEDIKEIIYTKNEELKQLFKKTCSVSALCNYIKPKFDEVAIATSCAAKGKDNPNYKYYNMSVDDILKLWKDKSDISKKYGSLLDDYVEFVLTNKLNSPEFNIWKLDNNFDDDIRLHNTCKGFDQFYTWLTTNTNYILVDREIPMYINPNSSDKINGRLDILFYDPNTDAYIIIDDKTTDDITTVNNYGKKFNGPAFMLDDCDMNAYTLQLHLYKEAIVNTYNLTTYDKVSVYVCNLLREPDPETGKLFKLFKQNFQFDNTFLQKIINFACVKHQLTKLK